MRYFYFPPLLTNRIHKIFSLRYSEPFRLKLKTDADVPNVPWLVYAWSRQIPQTGCGIIYPVMYKIVMMMVLWYDTTIHWYPLLPRLLIPRTIPFFPLSPPPPPPWPRASIIAARMSGVDNYLVSRECDGARDGSVTLFTVLSPLTPATMGRAATYPAWAHKCVTDTLNRGHKQPG